MLFKIINMFFQKILQIKLMKYYHMIQILWICLITQVACDTCRDIGETAIAARLETAGKAAMLLLAMPVFSELLQQALRLIGT